MPERQPLSTARESIQRPTKRRISFLGFLLIALPILSLWINHYSLLASKPYKDFIAICQASSDVINEIGIPLEFNPGLLNDREFPRFSSSVHLFIPVRGAKNSGYVYGDAKWVNGKWSIESITLEISNVGIIKQIHP